MNKFFYKLFTFIKIIVYICKNLKTLIMSNFKKTMEMQRKLLTLAIEWVNIIENPNTGPEDRETAVREFGKTMTSLIEFNLEIADL